MSSLSNALALLSAFGRTTPELGVTELANQLSLPKSSVSRLMAELERAGYLERTEARRYRTGAELFRVGSLYKHGSLPIDRIDAELKSALSRLPASGYVSINKGMETVILRMREGVSQVRFVVPEGSVVPAFTVAIGKAVLSRLSDAELDRIVPAHLHSDDPYYDLSKSDFLAELREGRARRWIELRDMANRGVAAFAAALIPTGGEPIGFAFSFMANTPEPVRAEMLDMLLGIGKTLGPALGDDYWL